MKYQKSTTPRYIGIKNQNFGPLILVYKIKTTEATSSQIGTSNVPRIVLSPSVYFSVKRVLFLQEDCISKRSAYISIDIILCLLLKLKTAPNQPMKLLDPQNIKYFLLKTQNRFFYLFVQHRLKTHSCFQICNILKSIISSDPQYKDGVQFTQIPSNQ